MRWFEKYAEDAPSTRRINPHKTVDINPFTEAFYQHQKELSDIRREYRPTDPAPPPSEEPVTEEPVTEEVLTANPNTRETILPTSPDENAPASNIIAGAIDNIKTILSFVQTGEKEKAVFYLQKAISDLENARALSEETENSINSIKEEILKSFANAKRNLFS